MAINKLFGVGQQPSVITKYQTEPQQNFVKNAFDFGKANPHCPEARTPNILKPILGDGAGSRLYIIG